MGVGAMIRRLREEREISLNRLAGELGLDPGNLSRQEREQQSVSETQLKRITEFFGLTLSEFYGLIEHENLGVRLPDGRRVAGARPVLEWEHPEDLPPGQYVLVPHLTLRASAGNGAWIEDHEIETSGSLAFLSDWIRRADITSLKNLVVVDVVGESMAPRIQGGDVLLVDRGQIRIRDGRVYVLHTPDGFKVKRLSWRPNRILVTSDNPADPANAPYEVKESELDELRIVGRAVWVGGNL